MAPSSLKPPLKRLRFWDNSWLLTTCGCRETTFVSGVGPGVRTVTPTSVPPAVMERQLKKAFAEAKDRVKNDEHGSYDQSLYVTDEPIKFSVVKKYPSGMPWVPLKRDEERPNNGRMTFVLLLKENQEQRMRNVVKEIKDTSGLTKHHCRKNVGYTMVTSSCDHRLTNINVGHTALRVLVAILMMVT